MDYPYFGFFQHGCVLGSMAMETLNLNKLFYFVE